MLRIAKFKLMLADY